MVVVEVAAFGEIQEEAIQVGLRERVGEVFPLRVEGGLPEAEAGKEECGEPAHFTEYRRHPANQPGGSGMDSLRQILLASRSEISTWRGTASAWPV